MKKKLKVPFARPVININKTINLIKEVLNKNFPNEGEFTRNFEKKISSLLKTKYVITSTSGTSAIFLALKAINVLPEDEVLVPNITFPATANAVKLTGAKVVLVDVNKNDLLINIDDLKKKITRKTKAIIPVHVSGRGGNILELIKFAKSKRIKVIEDAAEALTSKSGSRFLGTFGDAGCFSFAPNKIITTGQGGIIVTKDKKIFDSLKKLKDQGRVGMTTGGEDKYSTIGYNFKFTNLQGALGLSQLSNLKKRTKILRENYLIYEKNLKQNDNFRLIGFSIKKGEVPLWTDAYCKKRNALFKYLKSKGVTCRYFWHPINYCKPYKQSFSNFKNSKFFFKKLIWLPSSLDTNKKDILKVCKLINKFYET